MVDGCSNDKTMEENSAHALDETFVKGYEKTPGWAQLPPTERIKTGIIEFALGLLLFAALAVFCSFH